MREVAEVDPTLTMNRWTSARPSSPRRRPSSVRNAGSIPAGTSKKGTVYDYARDHDRNRASPPTSPSRLPPGPCASLDGPVIITLGSPEARMSPPPSSVAETRAGPRRVRASLAVLRWEARRRPWPIATSSRRSGGAPAGRRRTVHGPQAVRAGGGPRVAVRIGARGRLGGTLAR